MLPMEEKNAGEAWRRQENAAAGTWMQTKNVVPSRSKVNVEPVFGQSNAARHAKLTVLTFGRIKNAEN